MRINTNTWNKIRYTFYTPIYDLIANVFKNSRQRSISSINIDIDDQILIIGAGTGLDLEIIPDECNVIATDITPSMIKKIKNRNATNRLNLEAMEMDGQNIAFDDGRFNKVILHLILAVIPDPHKCIQEVDRVLKPGGEIAVFDKFIAKDSKISGIRKIVNPLTNLLFSDITRDIYSIVKGTNLEIVSDIPADFNGNFRLIKLRKKG